MLISPAHSDALRLLAVKVRRLVYDYRVIEIQAHGAGAHASGQLQRDARFETVPDHKLGRNPCNDQVPELVGVSVFGLPSSRKSLFGLIAGEPAPRDTSTRSSTWRRNSSTSSVECLDGSMWAGCSRVMVNPSMKLDDVQAWADALAASVGPAEITGSEDAYSAAAQGLQLRAAKIVSSAQPEETEHKKDDDDGTDEPDDSVHDGCPLLARVGQARPACAHRHEPADANLGLVGRMFCALSNGPSQCPSRFGWSATQVRCEEPR